VEHTTTPAPYIGSQLSIVNGSTNPLSFSGLTLRYYYTDEVNMTPNVSENWGHVSTTMGDQQITVNFSVHAITPAVTGADHYVEFTFSGGSGSCAPGQSITFSWLLQSPNPAAENYVQTNDYSFNAADTSLTATTKVTLWVNGSLASGTPPM
jgi:hypothetical protein